MNAETVARLKQTGYSISKAIWIASFVVEDDIAFGKAQKAWQVAAGLRKAAEPELGKIEQRKARATAEQIKAGKRMMAEVVDYLMGRYPFNRDYCAITLRAMRDDLVQMFCEDVAEDEIDYRLADREAATDYVQSWMLNEEMIKGRIAKDDAEEAEKRARHSSRSDVQPAELTFAEMAAKEDADFAKYGDPRKRVSPLASVAAALDSVKDEWED
jgi:hypothetical protein